MKDKNFLFTISLSFSLIFLVVFSCFVENTFFQSISQAIGFPLLIFTIASFCFSVKEEIANEYHLRAEIENEKSKTQIYSKAHFNLLLEKMKKIDNPKTDEEKENNDDIEEIKSEINAIDNRLKEICHTLAYYQLIEKDLNNNKIIPIFYALSLSFLFISLILPQIIAPLFFFAKSSTLTLISFLFPVLEILLRRPLSNKIVDCKIRKYKERVKNAQKN